MRARCLTLLVLGLALPLAAQTPDTSTQAAPATGEQAAAPAEAATLDAPNFAERRIDVGVQGVETDNRSSRFREYRSLPTGVFLPYARFAGRTNGLGYEVRGQNVLQGDASYHVRLEPKAFSLSVDYAKIPHAFGNDAHSLLTRTGAGRFEISDSLQQAFQNAIAGVPRTSVNFAFLNQLVTPSLKVAPGFDLGLTRERGNVEVALARDLPVDVKFTYFHEKRRGTRAVGTAFGFGTVVESPEPIDYRTQDYGVNAEWARSWGLVRGAFHYNQFTNNIQSHTWDNPFRATDSTDPSAYQAPGAASIGGPSFGRASLPPDNKAVTGSLGFAVKFAGRSRFSTDLAIGQWTQNAAFIPYTSNRAIPTPALPANSLDGKIDTLSFSAGVVSRPAKGITLQARVRRYDQDNKTRRIAFPGYVRFDTVFEDIPRLTVPYSTTNDRADASITWLNGPLTLEAGLKHDAWDRTYRETEKTNQNTFVGKADLRAQDWLVLRATFEGGHRDYEGLEIELSEDASFQSPGAPTNLLAVHASTGQPYASFGCGAAPCNLRYDQSKKSLRRYGAHLLLTPWGTATLTFAFLKTQDDYKETRFGLISDDRKTWSVDADYTPSARASLFAFYTREQLDSFQRGRQSGATVSFNPLDDWTSAVADKVDTVGGGATFGLVKDKLDLRVDGSYQRVDGNNDLFSPPGGTPDVAFDIGLYDDTKLLTLGGELGYRVRKDLAVSLGGWYEKYEIRDSNTSGLANFVPGSFFLAPVDSDYKAHVLYVKASYVW